MKMLSEEAFHINNYVQCQKMVLSAFISVWSLVSQTNNTGQNPSPSAAYNDRQKYI